MSLKNAIGGVALIAGTAIGAAVLALPASTAHLGFFPTIGIYLICWIFMTLGALYILEANLALGYGSNLITMAEKNLGIVGKYFTWVTYLVLLYALNAAYLTGASAWITQGFSWLDVNVSPFSAACLSTLLTLMVIFLGTAFTDWVNRFLMIGLISTFIVLLTFAFPEIDPHQLTVSQTLLDVRPIPLMITAFGFAIVIPTLTDYLHGKGRQLFYVILIGSLIPLLTYCMWEMTILGILPLEGSQGLLSIQKHGHPAIDIPNALESLLQKRIITETASGFSLFALITSILGVSLALFDFLADGLHLKKTFKHKILLSLITFLPPLSIMLFYPQFTFLLSFAGIAVAILLGIIPAMMAWQGRYVLHHKLPYRVMGGKAMIIVTIIFFLFVMGIETYNQCNLLFCR